MTNLAAEAGRMDSLIRQEAYSMINKQGCVKTQISSKNKICGFKLHSICSYIFPLNCSTVVISQQQISDGCMVVNEFRLRSKPGC